MAESCVHLHVHSEYSLPDGACRIDALAARASEFGQPALGLTDHGVMTGALELQRACVRHGIKPIVGCEVYLVEDHAARGPGPVRHHHLTLLAADPAGYRNLVTLSSRGFLEGFQSDKPGVDMAQLAEHSQGVIALTGCLASRFCRLLADDREEDARAHAAELMEAVGPDNVYFEVQKNGIDLQDRCNSGIARIARQLGRPVVGTTDVHYLSRDDHEQHLALMRARNRSTLAAPHLSFATNELYLRSSEEMRRAFAEWPDAIPTTLEIAERCNVQIPLGEQTLPRFDTPGGRDEKSYLRSLVEAGLRRRYGDPVPSAARARAEHELGAIDSLAVGGYFLILWDLVDFAKRSGIVVGPGRGSAASSIVAYCLGITDVDPLRYGLVFERLLNPDYPPAMPDIDLDFEVERRHELIDHLAWTYGEQRVAQISTFARFHPRHAIRSAARVLGRDEDTGERLAKLVADPWLGPPPDLERCLQPGEALRHATDDDPDASGIIEVARGLEGSVATRSIHAAAIVIGDRDLSEVVPLQTASPDSDVSGGETRVHPATQFSMRDVELLGLLKLDLLGLHPLDLIRVTLDKVEQKTGRRPDLEAIPLDDPATWELLASGDTAHVFQVESLGMREALRTVKPTRLEDLMAITAMYRPGTLDQITVYAHRKQHPCDIDYPDERLRPILQDTYGLIVYQEQIMQTAIQLAGFTGAQADGLRRALGKKQRDRIAAIKPAFERGGRASGTSKAVTDSVWTTLAAAVDASFCKAHAVSYALITYRSAWLEANHLAQLARAVSQRHWWAARRSCQMVTRRSLKGTLEFPRFGGQQSACEVSL